MPSEIERLQAEIAALENVPATPASPTQATARRQRGSVSASSSAPSRGILPPETPQLTVSFTAKSPVPGEAEALIQQAWELMLSMLPTHVTVSRGTPGPAADYRDPTAWTVRYNVLGWDK